MSQYVFGTGQLFTTPVGGGAPLRVGALQEVSVEFSGDIKQLFGQYQFPLDVARGKTKIEGKIGTANIDVAAFNSLFFGQTVTIGQKKQVFNEAGTIPASPGPYTVVAANGANFFQDLGVYYAVTGLPLVQVASSPDQGEYTVAPDTGTYTFNASDAELGVLLNYLWEDSASGGTLDIGNQLMGNTPKFQLIASQLYDGDFFTICLYSCVTDKLGLPLKMDDYLIGDIGFQAQANDANQIGFITTTSATGGGG